MADKQYKLKLRLSNGNDIDAGTFTVPQGEKGDTGATGAAGKDGKSAYEYAKDGGFAGTEEEFGKKLAQTKFPNPKPIAFIETFGTADMYDGSEGKTIVLRRAIYINITTEDGETWSASESFNKIIQYAGAGYPVYAVVDVLLVPLIMYDESSIGFCLTIAGGDVFVSYGVTISSDNSVLVEIGETYIPTDEHIGSIVDAKLGVIENGSY